MRFKFLKDDEFDLLVNMIIHTRHRPGAAPQPASGQRPGHRPVYAGDQPPVERGRVGRHDGPSAPTPGDGHGGRKAGQLQDLGADPAHRLPAEDGCGRLFGRGHHQLVKAG